MYYIYILRCSGGQLYTGIAADIHRRIREHSSRSGKCAKYTKSHGFEAVEAVWSAENRSLASKLEQRIKKLPREKKLNLIAEPELVSTLAQDGETFTPQSEIVIELNIKNPLD